MDIIPPELLIIIFEKIDDPYELLKLRSVCSKWSTTIDKMKIMLSFWRNLCNEDEIKPWIFEIIEKKFPRAIKKTNKTRVNWSPIIWKKIYLSFRRWHHYLKLPYFFIFFDFRQIFTTGEELTCMDVWANYFAVGSNIGKVYFFTTKSCMKGLFTIHSTTMKITNIKFWYTISKNLIAVISLDNQKLEFWDVINQHKIQNPYEDQPSVSMISKAHRFFIASKYELIEYEWIQNALQKGEKLEFKSSRNIDPRPNLDIVDIYADQTKVTVMRSNFIHIMVEPLEISTLRHLRFVNLVDEFSIHSMEPERNYNVKCHIPTTDVMFIVTDLYFYVAVKLTEHEEHFWKTYSLPENLRNNVSSILFYSNIFFFGLRSGTVLIYFFKSIFDNLEINLPMTISKTLNIDTEPINHLNVLEFKDSVSLLAMTKFKLHIIKFYDISSNTSMSNN